MRLGQGARLLAAPDKSSGLLDSCSVIDKRWEEGKYTQKNTKERCTAATDLGGTLMGLKAGDVSSKPCFLR